jgi:transcriptional regulator with XRE-family HTH domain
LIALAVSAWVALMLAQMVDPDDGTIDIALLYAARLRLGRLRRNMSQRDLAVAIGVDRQAVTRWEHGREPEKRTREAIARVLGYPVAFFYTALTEKEQAELKQLDEDAA